MASKKLWFVAESENLNSFFVYKKGGSIVVSGPNFYEHVCHPSVKTIDKVKAEIFLVFNEKISKIDIC